MPGIQDRINAVLATVQNLFTVLRDVFLAVLLIFLLMFPSQLNSMLSKAGITQLNGGVFTWQQAKQAADQGTAAAEANDSASETLDSVKSTLEDIASKTLDPAIKKLATDASTQASGSIASLDTANNSLAQSVVTLQAAPGAPSGAQTSPSTGWVMLGTSDPTHENWTKSTTPKAAGVSPGLTAGQVITFTDNVFLRGGYAQGQAFNLAPILGAARSGSTAVVTQVQYVPNRKGNLRVWARVNVKSGS